MSLNTNTRFFTVLALVLLVSPACLWDHDTIQMERHWFPETNELIVGKFLRHSPEFYKWRIKDREAKIRRFPDSLVLYNDLAVAYSKLENNKKAIEIMLQKEKIKPGLYETYANLGTFYIHDGQLEKGLTYINKAIQINPAAHFGREVYQKYVVEYILMKRRINGKISLPLSSVVHDPIRLLDLEESEEKKLNSMTFKNFLSNKNKGIDTSHLKALTGVKGMMKFGNYDSPVLLEVLGDLLYISSENSNQLAARAYMAAFYKTKKILYKQKAESAISMQHDLSTEKFEIDFRKEIKEGEDFYNQIRQDEMEWIQKGINPEEAFAKKYYKNPVLDLDYKVLIETDSGFRAAETKLNKQIPLTKDTKVVAQPNAGFLVLLSILGLVLLGFWAYFKYVRS